MDLVALLFFALAAMQVSPPIPAPGQMVDIGGWRLHLNCTGTSTASQPTVLEAGAGSFSVDWSLVQPEVAQFARVCSYDRAGLGWSEQGPHPRTLHQVVWELHAVLEKADIRPPYVFVGHSYGGIIGRLYAFTYPSDIRGVVLVDSGYESGVMVLQNGKLFRLTETAAGKPVPPVKTSGPLRESDIKGEIRKQIEAAAQQMAAQALDPPYDRLPAEAQRMRAWSFGQVKHWATNDNPSEGEELAALLAEQKKEHPLGDTPVIVISRGLSEGQGPDSQAVEEEHTRNQAALLKLSTTSKQIVAQKSGHEIMIYQPDLVVSAIRDVLTDAKK